MADSKGRSSCANVEGEDEIDLPPIMESHEDTQNENDEDQEAQVVVGAQSVSVQGEVGEGSQVQQEEFAQGYFTSAQWENTQNQTFEFPGLNPFTGDYGQQLDPQEHAMEVAQGGDPIHQELQQGFYWPEDASQYDITQMTSEQQEVIRDITTESVDEVLAESMAHMGGLESEADPRAKRQRDPSTSPKKLPPQSKKRIRTESDLGAPTNESERNAENLDDSGMQNQGTQRETNEATKSAENSKSKESKSRSSHEREKKKEDPKSGKLEKSKRQSSGATEKSHIFSESDHKEKNPPKPGSSKDMLRQSAEKPHSEDQILNFDFIISLYDKESQSHTRHGLDCKKALRTMCEKLGRTDPSRWNLMFIKTPENERMRSLIKSINWADVNSIYWGKNYKDNPEFLEWAKDQKGEIPRIHGTTSEKIGRYFKNDGLRNITAALLYKLLEARGPAGMGHDIRSTLGESVMELGRAVLESKERQVWSKRITLPADLCRTFPYAYKEGEKIPVDDKKLKTQETDDKKDDSAELPLEEDFSLSSVRGKLKGAQKRLAEHRADIMRFIEELEKSKLAEKQTKKLVRKLQEREKELVQELKNLRLSVETFGAGPENRTRHTMLLEALRELKKNSDQEKFLKDVQELIATEEKCKDKKNSSTQPASSEPQPSTSGSSSSAVQRPKSFAAGSEKDVSPLQTGQTPKSSKNSSPQVQQGSIQAPPANRPNSQMQGAPRHSSPAMAAQSGNQFTPQNIIPGFGNYRQRNVNPQSFGVLRNPHYSGNLYPAFGPPMGNTNYPPGYPYQFTQGAFPSQGPSGNILYHLPPNGHQFFRQPQTPMAQGTQMFQTGVTFPSGSGIYPGGRSQESHERVTNPTPQTASGPDSQNTLADSRHQEGEQSGNVRISQNQPTATVGSGLELSESEDED